MIPLSLIIATSAGRQNHLRHCLLALRAQTLSPAEVLVIDDGSEGMQAVLAEFEGLWPRLEYHWRTADYNLSRSRNLGAALSQTAGLVFANGDVLLNPHALAHYAAALNARPKATFWGYVGCRKSVKAPSLWFPDIQVNWLDFRFFPRSTTELFLNPTLAHAPHTLAGGHHFALNRATWEQLGPLDEAFEYWGEEDVEYALRGLVAGIPMVFLGEAWAEHMAHPYGEIFHTRANAALEYKVKKILAGENALLQRQTPLQDLVIVSFEKECAILAEQIQRHYLPQQPNALDAELRLGG
ncbi:MAG: glycosyltransferase family 2 protein [Candidatus Sericytochromatia bacterium]